MVVQTKGEAIDEEGFMHSLCGIRVKFQNSPVCKFFPNKKNIHNGKNISIL